MHFHACSIWPFGLRRKHGAHFDNICHGGAAVPRSRLLQPVPSQFEGRSLKLGMKQSQATLFRQTELIRIRS